MKIVDSEIVKLQDNLQAIRKIAGWSCEDLGDQIGVTKQTISNLENGNTTMTKTQYIAIRTVIDYEILSSNNTTLRTVVDALLNSDEDAKREVNETTKQFQKLVNSKAASKEEQKRKENAKNALVASAGILGITAIALMDSPEVLLTTMHWIGKIIKKK